jgi:hypothetical protein
MKYQHFIVVFGIVITTTLVFSCRKDQVPTVTVAPNCIDTVHFATQIAPMIANNCIGCHDVGNSTGYTLTNHTNISANASAVLNSLQGASVALMPQGGPPLNDSLIQQFTCWISQGTLNN